MFVVFSTLIESSRSPASIPINLIGMAKVHTTLFVPPPLHSVAASSIGSTGSVTVTDVSVTTTVMSFALPAAAVTATWAWVGLVKTATVLFADADVASSNATADDAMAASTERDPEPMGPS